MDGHSRGERQHDGGAVITGRAPVSGGIAIACGLLFVTTVVLAVTVDLSWFTAASTLMTFALTVFIWRGFKASDREYRQRRERLDQRMGRES